MSHSFRIYTTQGQHCQNFNRTIEPGHYSDSMDSERLVKISAKQPNFGHRLYRH